MRDAAGTIFDPQIHQIRYGKPLLRRKDGCFVLKKGVKRANFAPKGTETHGIAQFGETSKTAESATAAAPEIPQSAESFVDAILSAGESVPTVPAPESAPESAPEGVAPDETASFIPDDLTFPEETPGGDEGFFTSAEAHARAQDPEAEKPKMTAEAASISAFSIVEITEQTCAVLLGEEMEMQPEEKKRLVQAWENYLATTEGVEIPPWAAALGLTALYFGTRLMLPAVQMRLKNIWRNLNGQPPIQPAVSVE